MHSVTFLYPEDEVFFRALLCQGGEDLSRYADLFDFRPPHQKRREFGSRYRVLLQTIQAQYGDICQLQFNRICTMESGITLDHIIPLSSNRLNKMLRNIIPAPQKKVPTQSFGSNHPRNLIIACKACNIHKQNAFLEAEVLMRILKTKDFDRMEYN
jgi:5-methylcytosine-specific restriction endonuclease McrA